MVSSAWKLRLSLGVLGTIVALLLSAVSSAAAIKNPAARSASVPFNCQGFHAGRVVGDGLYTRGALVGARGVSCSKAWSLVLPNYQHVIRLERDGAGSFTLGNFRCHVDPNGPAPLQICGRPGAVFFFY
jgi:hypothetical protein